MSRRVLWRMLVTLLLAAAGASFLSGSGQPVTAVPYPRWQEIAPPPLSPRADALGIQVGHRVLVLGGPGPAGARDGAAYDVHTGLWRRLRSPIPVTDSDRAAVAAGVVVLRHERPGRRASWWRYDVRLGTWTRMRHLPPHLGGPTAFASEVYALSGRRVVVYSVQLGRWTPLTRDPLRPALRRARVSVSRAGTVVTGTTGPRSRAVADRWDGLRWRRSAAAPLLQGGAAGRGIRLDVGGRTFVVRRGRAWIRLP